MIPKPVGCLGCPLYGDGQGFVPDEINEHTEVMIVAQNPGEHEEKGTRVVGYGPRPGTYMTEPCRPAPLIGPTGFMLTRDFLPQAGLTREQVSLGNILKCRLVVNGKRTNDMPSGKILTEAVAHCTQAHFYIPSTVRLVVTMGAHAARHMGLRGTITDWRGFLVPADHPIGFEADAGVPSPKQRTAEQKSTRPARNKSTTTRG